jgi:hypothetical protein
MNVTPASYPAPIAFDGDIAALRERQFAELARLRDLGMQTVETVSRWSTGDLTDGEVKALAGMGGYVMEYCRAAKAVRQIIILELELAGVREGPDREGVKEPREIDAQDDVEIERGEKEHRERGGLYERGDYDNGPLDQVLAGIRKALRTDAPPDDPFKPKRPRQKPESDTPENDVQVEAASNDAGDTPRKTAVAPAFRPSNDFGAAPVHPMNRAERRRYNSKRAERAARSRGPPQ